jgi:hypothetical protein
MIDSIPDRETRENREIKKKEKKKNWIETLVDECDDSCVIERLDGSKVVSYQVVARKVYESHARFYKSMDYVVFRRHVVSVIASLEVRHKINDLRENFVQKIMADL